MNGFARCDRLVEVVCEGFVNKMQPNSLQANLQLDADFIIKTDGAVIPASRLNNSKSHRRVGSMKLLEMAMAQPVSSGFFKKAQKVGMMNYAHLIRLVKMNPSCVNKITFIWHSIALF
jgi:hypothetical protein